MISIVMPFYKKYEEFVDSFENVNFNELNRLSFIELVISIDDPTESEDLLFYLQKKTITGCHFSIKILLNDEEHEWRCPSKAINQGIKQAAHDKIIVISPETLILPNSILKLETHCNETDFSFGIVKHASPSELNFSDLEKNFQTLNAMPLPYGSICFTRQQATSVGGYNENYIIWGGDDDDFRNRLLLAGYNKKPIFAKFIHTQMTERALNCSKDKIVEKTRFFLQKKIEEISNTIDFKINSSLLSKETVKKIFEFHP